MKKILNSGIWVALVCVLFLSACVTKNDESMVSLAPPERRDLPGFFLNPPVLDDQYIGLGMASLSNDNLSRTTALARARADIAAQVAVVVESMLTDYAQESGEDSGTQTLVFIERVSKEVANIELRGAVTQEQYPANDGTWYVMVFFPKNALLDEVQQVFSRNEDSAFAEFKAQQAIERLNSELENNPVKSAGIDSPVNQN